MDYRYEIKEHMKKLLPCCTQNRCFLELLNILVPIAYLEANQYDSDRISWQEKDEGDAEIGLLLYKIVAENFFGQLEEYYNLDKQGDPNDK